MSKTIEIDGVSLTVDKWREVLAFWGAHCVGEVPKCLRLTFDGADEQTAVWSLDWRRPGRDLLALTPDLAEKIRDAVEPWTEVRRDEVQPGETFRAIVAQMGPSPLLLADASAHGGWCVSQGVRRVDSREIVLVRRPLKPALTLGEVEPGTRVRASSGEEAIRGQSVSEDYVEVWLVKRHTGDRWCASAPVEIVEDES